MKYIIFFLLIVLTNSCVSYIDLPKNSISNDNMIFDYGSKENKFKYINKVNASADNDIYYTTHFSIDLPKGIVNWKISNNNFFFEYGDKQILYIYSSYKNDGKESANWKLEEIGYNEIVKYIGEYWDERRYNENYLYKKNNGRISKIYTNGKYKIVLYNVKIKSYPMFIQMVKTFDINM